MNNNDFKYIINRVLVFIIISIILFCFNSCKAKADVIGTTINYTLGCTSNSGTVSNSVISTLNWSSDIQNKGQGYLITTFNVVSKTGNGQSILNGVRFRQRINGIDSYIACDVGNALSYFDSGVEQTLYTAKCPINTNQGITNTAVIYDFYSTYPETCVKPYAYSTFVTDSNEAQQIVNGINGALAQLINQNTINSQITQNAINTGIQNVTSAVQQQTQASQNINNSINDTTPVSNNEISGNTADWNSNNLQNGTITQLLTLPITLIQAYLNGINSSCTSFNLGSLFGTDLILPCINVSNYLGTALWSTIDILFSGFMILNIGKKLIKIFNDFTNLNSNQAEELYGGGA